MANLHYTIKMTRVSILSLLSLFVYSTTAIAQELDISLWNSGINYSRYSDANKELIKEKVTPITVLMGDSITDGWINQHPEFFENNSIIDRGISGETTSQMLMRFREDVINLHPQVVAILAGINDVAENTGQIAIEKVFENIISMADLARANNIKVVLCKLVPANRFPWRERIVPTDKVKILNNLIESYAADNGIVLVDYYSSMADDNRGLRADLGSDGIHPNSKGYRIMEPLLLEGIHKALKEN